mmetsp:Transcript_8212/g.7284  ORF Transcript_8212/g.7284 Transcript_8212/m.7284 type:complete len:131 (-) Transcript_8212:913-1305(-)
MLESLAFLKSERGLLKEAFEYLLKNCKTKVYSLSVKPDEYLTSCILSEDLVKHLRKFVVCWNMEVLEPLYLRSLVSRFSNIETLSLQNNRVNSIHYLFDMIKPNLGPYEESKLTQNYPKNLRKISFGKSL